MARAQRRRALKGLRLRDTGRKPIPDEVGGDGRPPTDIRTIIELIGATTTNSRLTAQVAYDPNWYPIGKRISDADYATIPLPFDDWHGEWNYGVTPA